MHTKHFLFTLKVHNFMSMKCQRSPACENLVRTNYSDFSVFFTAWWVLSTSFEAKASFPVFLQTFRSLVTSPATSLSSTPMVSSPMGSRPLLGSSDHVEVVCFSEGSKSPSSSQGSVPTATNTPEPTKRCHSVEGEPAKRACSTPGESVDGAALGAMTKCLDSQADDPTVPQVVVESSIVEQPEALDETPQRDTGGDTSDLSIQSLSASFVNSLAASGLATLAALAPSPKSQEGGDSEEKKPTVEMEVESAKKEESEEQSDPEKVFLSGLDTLAAVAPSPPAVRLTPSSPAPDVVGVSGEEDSLMLSCTALANSLSALKTEGEATPQLEDDSRCSEVVRAAQVLVSVLRRCSGSVAEQLPNASAMLKGACQPLITDSRQDADVEVSVHVCVWVWVCVGVHSCVCHYVRLPVFLSW